jgi:hypothetical protein
LECNFAKKKNQKKNREPEPEPGSRSPLSDTDMDGGCCEKLKYLAGLKFAYITRERTQRASNVQGNWLPVISYHSKSNLKEVENSRRPWESNLFGGEAPSHLEAELYPFT